MSARRGSGNAGSSRGGNATKGAGASQSTPRELRIIAGRWRGRRWQFPAGTTIRPTPDRVRETLFNWLMGPIVAARCLDAFAGSGALGLEALSRGAAAVTFVETDRGSAAALRQRLQDWDAQGACLVEIDAIAWLELAPVQTFNIVFLDPPFAAGLLPRALAALETRGWLADDAWIYVETAADAALPTLPGSCTLHRSGRAGEVGYYLLRREAAARTSVKGDSSQ